MLTAHAPLVAGPTLPGFDEILTLRTYEHLS